MARRTLGPADICGCRSHVRNGLIPPAVTYSRILSFDDAIAVFRDPVAKLFDDPDHSNTEERMILVGHAGGRLLVGAFTQRQGRIRVVSARRATARERQDYEHETS